MPVRSEPSAAHPIEYVGRICGSAALVFAIGIGAAFFFYVRREAQTTVELRTRIILLEAELYRVDRAADASRVALHQQITGGLAEATKAREVLHGEVVGVSDRVSAARTDALHVVEEGLKTQVPAFVKLAKAEFGATALDTVRAKRLIVVDDADNERVVLGTGTSEHSGDPNSFIQLTSPSGINPIRLSTTDVSASVMVDKRVALGADDKGNAGLVMFRSQFKKGDKPAISANVRPDSSGLGIYDSDGQPKWLAAHVGGDTVTAVMGEQHRYRTVTGLQKDGRAYSQIYDQQGELVYAIQSGSDPYAVSFLKQDPKSQMWDAASTFSTLKTFWDIVK